MIKFLFFDWRETETVKGFTRQIEQPVKHPANPFFIADQPWENGNMQLYGSVIKAPGRPFQAWYSTIKKPWWIYLAYAESDDGIEWRKPLFDIFKHRGRKTNIVLTPDIHGPAVIYDAADEREDWRYKMIAGAAPSNCICAFKSADGIRWEQVGRAPVMSTHPDCPMGFLRLRDGRYVAYHRFVPFSGRRVTRSESWNFRQWTSDPRIVFEPDAGDPPQIQFYGMGVFPYGGYELGTVWIYHTDTGDTGPGKMCGYQETELAYCRTSYAWHRAAQGQAFISHGSGEDWDHGNLQCASQPVLLDDEIRFYFMGTTMRHKVHWELDPQRAGLGMATMKPDRFIALAAGKTPAELLTVSFGVPTSNLFVNARTARDGWVKVEALDAAMQPLKGFEAAQCMPITGDSTSAPVRWRGADIFTAAAGKPIRLRVTARNARLYSIFATDPNETPVYHKFRAVRP